MSETNPTLADNLRPVFGLLIFNAIGGLIVWVHLWSKKRRGAK